MRQITLSVALDVKPENFERLGSMLDQLQTRAKATSDNGGVFADFLSNMSVLHFMSLSLFPGYDHDPLFVLEANFDGEPGPFWAQLEAAIGRELRECLKCCKPPRDERATLFDALTRVDPQESRAPLAPYFEACAVKPSVFHHGNRGMTRDRIMNEFALFCDLGEEIAAPGRRYRSLRATDVHRNMRASLIDKHAWLAAPAPLRIAPWDNFIDWLKLAFFAFGAVFVLSIPGLVLVLAAGHAKTQYFLALAAAFLLLAWRLRNIADLPPTTTKLNAFRLVPLLLPYLPYAVAFVALYWVVVSALGTPLSVLLRAPNWPPAWPAAWVAAWAGMLTWIGQALMSVPVTVVAVLVWLRTLERRDSSHDAPPVDPHFLREMAKREDWIPQNHMGSIVLIKPGVLRAMLIRAGHLGLFLILRVQAQARDGYLGSMRTIHFAHWAFVSNKSRLLFFSNFDQTWESYLDDFIEKAHPGLTLAWSCGVGFPPARFLLFDGASRGRQFKEWARHSMAVSHFWYSAYKDLTTEQIERNYRIALGLRKPTLTEKEAVAWLNDL